MTEGPRVDASDVELVIDMTNIAFVLMVERSGQARVMGTVPAEDVPKALRQAAKQLETGRHTGLVPLRPDDVDGI